MGTRDEGPLSEVEPRQSMSEGEIRVLLVDDEPDLATVTGELLREQNPAITPVPTTSASEALNRLSEEEFEAVVSDYDMPGMDGLAFLEAVREDYPDLPFILFTGKGSEEIASEAISAGVTDYLQKDTGMEQYELLANRITNAIAQTRARREYHEAQARFEALTENAPFVVVTIDEHSTIRYVNDSVQDVFGYDPDEITGKSLLTLMPDRFEDAHRAGIERYLRTGNRNLDWNWIELPGQHADGHEVPLGITFGERAEGESHLFTGILRDISEQKFVEAERELLHTTIRAAAEAETFIDGLQAVIREVCEQFDWAYGEAWAPAPHGSHLDRTDAAYTTSEEFEAFEEVSAVTSFGPGEGLPGRAWSRQGPVWMPNVSALTEDVFPRVQAAANVGLKAALGVPITTEGEVVAVLAFYMAEEKEEDERLTDIVTTVATELGELIERKQKTDALQQRERELAHQRDELEQLNRLNAVIRNIVEATIEAESRTEIEEMVCERLIAEDPFVFAWIGEVDRTGNHVQPRAVAGDGSEYLDEITIATGDQPTGRGPTGKAVSTREVQVVERIAEDPAYAPWREQARERGFESSAAIPIIHEERLYGVLNVYADQPVAFGSREQEVLGELGQAIGKAISAIEQREALLSDKIVELELRSEDLASQFRRAADDEASIEVSIDRIIPAGDRTFQFISGVGLSAKSLVTVLEGFETITDVEVLETGTQWCRVKATSEGRTLAEVLADNGGRIRSMRYEDREFRIVVELPFSADVRQVVEVMASVQSDLELVSQRTVERTGESVGEFRDAFESELTDRQRTVLELAYHSGFFEWPRESTGEEIAESMDLAPATFHQHLRTGQRKLLKFFYEDLL